MRKITFAILFIFSIASLVAQTEISGTVTDSAGEPIPGANVFIADSNSGATTDFDGN